MWATFLTLLVGVIVAALGGLLGGLGDGRREPAAPPAGRRETVAEPGQYARQPQPGRADYTEPAGPRADQPDGVPEPGRPQAGGRRGRR